ncbi:16S rRNA (uracil(1498)-N(3))-methyltransferase [Schlesneria paludicola]|uniref:16S rRNA (uracil(1498)-N(3))-methyltransferase n=1 Tax=Schlesneria paludicola TaxID=360056 RepID=UPI00029B3D8B|nr:16S rRNA (uracil(1498)-N(3))-methyltransferase [Schlesneria paludicola]
MTHRFYCSDLSELGSVRLVETEAHHLVHVLRHDVGDQVELFDGRGLAAICRITAVRKRDADLEILTSRRDPVPLTLLTLATGVPKGDRFEWLIEKATELGVARVIPLTTTRSVVDPRDSKLDKLRQTVITACKQSGQNHLMEITPVVAWTEFLRDHDPAAELLIAHPRGADVGLVSEDAKSSSRAIIAAIGPEGGFSDDEVQSAVTHGAKIIRLGPRILRIETAALALAAKILL